MNAISPGRKASDPPGDSCRAILHAAMDLFGERGFGAVPVSAIAERAGVSKGNIFHHFGSKDGLYLAVIRQAAGNTERLLGEANREEGAFADRIRHFARGHLNYLVENPCIARLILRELAEGDPDRSRSMVEGAFGANFATLVALFRHGQAEGVVRNDLDPAVVALALLAGNVFFFQTQPLLPHLASAQLAADPAYYSDMVVNLFLNGILTVPA